MKPLRIAIDANEANVNGRVGSNVYAYRILSQLEHQTRDSQDFVFTIYLSSQPVVDMPPQRKNWTYRVLTPSKFWTQWRFPLELLLHHRAHDLVVSLGHYAPRWSPIPTVVCVMDLAYLKFPQFFRPKDLMQLRSWTEYSVRKAKRIITISQSSRLDIIKEYHRGPEEISIVPPGVDAHVPEVEKQQEEEYLDRLGLKGKYLACVGTIQPRKNTVNLIKAFERLDDKEVKLVFVGKKGWLTSEFEEAVEMSPAKDRIVITGFVEEWQKYCLLKNSHGSVLVGFYEGFGIPPIEGMSVGVVPVVANTASLPEVVGELGIQVDPYSIDDIAAGLQKVIKLKVTPELVNKLKARAKFFSWKNSGVQMLSAIRKALER